MRPLLFVHIASLVALASSCGAGGSRTITLLEIEVAVDSAFADTAASAPCPEDAGPGPVDGGAATDSGPDDDVDGGAASNVDGGPPCALENADTVILDGCTPLTRKHDQLVVPPSVPTLDDVVGALELQHQGPDSFGISLIDTGTNGPVGRRTDLLVRGQLTAVVAAHAPDLVLYRVDEEAALHPGDLPGAPSPSDEMLFTYDVRGVEVQERHRVLSREEVTMNVRYRNDIDCGCASAPIGSLSPALLLALALRARRRSPPGPSP